MKQVNIIVGRFQPITNGHIRCLKEVKAKTKCPTVICLIDVPETRLDPRHPFPTTLLEQIYKELFRSPRYSKLVADIVTVKNADIVAIGNALYEKGYEIRAWVCGTDRVASYQTMADKYREQAHLPTDFEVVEVKRDTRSESATKLRQAMLDDNREVFMMDFPSVGQSQAWNDNIYTTLRSRMLAVNKIKESTAKTRKSFNAMMNESEQVNESLLLAGLFVSLVCLPILNTEVGKGIGSMFASLGTMFSNRIENKKKKLEFKIEEEKGKIEIERLKKELADLKNPSKAEQLRTAVGEVSNNKDVSEKQRGLLATVAACTTDADGKDVDPEDMGARLEEVTGQKPEDWAKENGVKEISKEDAKKATEQLTKQLDSKSDEELEELESDTKKVAAEQTEKLAAAKEKKEKEGEGEDEKKEEGEKDDKADDTKKEEDKKEEDKKEKEEEKDEDGNIVRDEEVEVDGKKKKVSMHIGPRGGKFYWPEGSPKDDEHKVYVESISRRMTLSQFLGRR